MTPRNFFSSALAFRSIDSCSLSSASSSLSMYDIWSSCKTYIRVKFQVECSVLTFFSRSGEARSRTELKVCNGELPLRSLDVLPLLGLERRLPVLFSIAWSSRGFVTCGKPHCLTGEPSLLPTRGLMNTSDVFIGDIVRSGDKVIRCFILTGDVGESKLCDRARVSAIKRRACSRNLT